MDERCFRPLLCTVKAELGRGRKIKRVGALRGGLQKKCEIKRVGTLKCWWRVDCEYKCKIKRVGHQGDCGGWIVKKVQN